MQKHVHELRNINAVYIRKKNKKGVVPVEDYENYKEG
jgi:hypothetical protein